MKVLELLDEIEEIIDTATSVPMSNKIFVDADEILAVVHDIRRELPDEMQQAQWITNERQRIMDKAKQEYEEILRDAKKQAESLIESDDITVKAKKRADEIMQVAAENARVLKMSTFDYIDSLLYNFQDKMDQLNATYFNDMFNNLQKTFEQVNGTLAENREEIKEMIYRAQEEQL